MNGKNIDNELNSLLENALEIEISGKDKIVVFSDLHLGDGGVNDDFKKNSQLFQYVLKNHYLKKKFALVLNGDVEELYKFSMRKIYEQWKDVYELFDMFRQKNGFYKLIGNHDYESLIAGYPEANSRLLESLKLNYSGESLLIYHGHQTAHFLETYNPLAIFLVRYIVNPLKIKNPTASISSGTKFKTEMRAYDFSTRNKIASILGHTHRPLFESTSKIDELKNRIDRLIRKYPKVNAKARKNIAKQLKKLKKDLFGLHEHYKEYNLRSSIYDERLLVPCLFNSGSAVGDKGMTGIEINKGKISLVYWFDKKYSKKYIKDKETPIKRLDETNYYKAILKKESLDYIFSRINLLC